MRRIYVDRVYTLTRKVGIESKWSHEATLGEIKAVYFGASASDECVAGGEVVGKCTAEARGTGAIVESALCMELKGAITLEVEGFGPVI